MPRRTAASLAIAPNYHPLPALPPPASLTPAEVALWRRIAASKPHDFFDDGGLHLLADLCRHQAAFDALSAQMAPLDLADAAQLERFDKLAAMRDREGKAVRGLSVALRLQNQARYTAPAARTAAQRPGPRGIEALIGPHA